MSLTFTEARDEILSLFKTAWDAQAAPIPQLLYWDVTGDPPTGNDSDGDPDPWARITVRHVIGENDAIGGSLFNREGVVTVQIFSPFGTGLQINDNLAKIAVDAFQGKKTAGGVNFTNVRLNEIGQDGIWFQSNILADFDYCEVI